MQIKNIEDFKIISSKLPREIVIDVQSRILDHLMSGGNMEDSYIEQQFRYIEKVLDALDNRKFTQETLNKILEEIIAEYFDEDFQGGLWEVMEFIKIKHKYEVSTLPAL